MQRENVNLATASIDVLCCKESQRENVNTALLGVLLAHSCLTVDSMSCSTYETSNADRPVILTVYSSSCAEPQFQDKELKQAFVLYSSCSSTQVCFVADTVILLLCYKKGFTVTEIMKRRITLHKACSQLGLQEDDLNIDNDDDVEEFPRVTTLMKKMRNVLPLLMIKRTL